MLLPVWSGVVDEADVDRTPTSLVGFYCIASCFASLPTICPTKMEYLAQPIANARALKVSCCFR